MRNITENVNKINKEGKKAFRKAGGKGEFYLTLRDFPIGRPESRLLLALAFTLSFIPQSPFAYLRDLLGLPYHHNDTNTIIDNGVPTTEAVNTVISVTAELCQIEVDQAFYLTEREVRTTYNAALAKAKSKVASYEGYNSMYSDKGKFEIGELDA